MRRTSFRDAECPIARASDLIGDGWSPLIMREASGGVRRFEDFQRRLDIPRATLAARLDRLVGEGLLRRVPYQDQPPRDEYRMTRKGDEFFTVLAAMWRWSSDWLFDDAGPLIELADAESGDVVRPLVVDESTGRPIRLAEIRVRVRPRPALGL